MTFVTSCAVLLYPTWRFIQVYDMYVLVWTQMIGAFFSLKNLTYWYFPFCDVNNWCYLFFTLIICLRESLTQDDVTFIGEGLKILTNAQSLQPLRMPHMLQSGAAVWIVDLLCDSCQGFVSRISTSSYSHFIRDSASMRGGRCKSVLYYAILFKWCFAKNNYFFHFSSLKKWAST